MAALWQGGAEGETIALLALPTLVALTLGY